MQLTQPITLDVKSRNWPQSSIRGPDPSTFSEEEYYTKGRSAGATMNAMHAEISMCLVPRLPTPNQHDRALVASHPSEPHGLYGVHSSDTEPHLTPRLSRGQQRR
jgi:hypothetical protein